MRGVGRLSGVVCDDRALVRRTVTGLLLGSGFDVAGEVTTFPALRELVRRTSPTVAVVPLPLTGMSGLAAVRRLRAEAPSCEVVLLSAFEQLTVDALEAGALALVPEDAPHALQAVLRQIAATARPVTDDLRHLRRQPEALAASEGLATG